MFGDAFPRKRIERWRKATRRVTSARAAAAQIETCRFDCLCRILGGLTDKTCFVGIAHVLVQLRRDRERLQKQVVKAVKRLRAKGVLREMRRTTGKTLRRLAASPGNPPRPPRWPRPGGRWPGGWRPCSSGQQVSPILRTRAGHHALRIEVKRLRYTMEICRPLYGGRLDGQIEAVKRLQTLLGEIHDCDVWFGHLDGVCCPASRSGLPPCSVTPPASTA